MLALSFPILIGVTLVGESLGPHIPKGYIDCSMASAFLVEMLNHRHRPKSAKTHPLSCARRSSKGLGLLAMPSQPKCHVMRDTRFGTKRGHLVAHVVPPPRAVDWLALTRRAISPESAGHSQCHVLRDTGLRARLGVGPRGTAPQAGAPVRAATAQR